MTPCKASRCASTTPTPPNKSPPQSRQILGPDWSLLTWGDQYRTFFALINQQRVMMYFALSFIVLVSAFSMMAVMFTVTIQKRREIGVMKALGAAPGQIVRVFLYQGMLLGLLGAVLGVGLGRLVIHFRGPIQGLFRALRLRSVRRFVHRLRRAAGPQRSVRAGGHRLFGLRSVLAGRAGAGVFRRPQRCRQIPAQPLTHGHLDHSKRRKDRPDP